MGKSLVTVKVRKGDINKALKQFKRAVINSGHIDELKSREAYIKPTTIRRREKQVAIRNQKIELMKQNEIEIPSKKKKKKR
jgi:small subunit ribosomal protein S21|tara:strand:- start:2216 stop:2458 length:243 start_codon:yes stop_codon:yes gene_type:complete